METKGTHRPYQPKTGQPCHCKRGRERDNCPDKGTKQSNAKLIAAAPDLLEAVRLLQAALTEYHLRDVKKRYSLCVADAAASSAIAKATT